GYPRIGEQRELKKAVELYWKGELPAPALESVAREIRRRNWNKQSAAGIDLVPCNDFSLYDQMLDASCLFGNVPARFRKPDGRVGRDTMFAIARGIQDGRCGCGAPASEMT